MKAYSLVITSFIVSTTTAMSVQDATKTFVPTEELLEKITDSGSQFITKLSRIVTKSNENLDDLKIIRKLLISELSPLSKLLSTKLLNIYRLEDIVDALGIQQDFVKPLEKILNIASKLDFTMSSKNISKFIDNPVAKEGKNANSGTPTEEVSLESISMSASNMWMVIKSLWYKILAHVKQENSISAFMNIPAVRAIDFLLSLGDDINLVNLLTKKLDPSLAEFVASQVSPYLGPLKNFQSFYAFLKDNDLNGILDYFGTKRFQYSFDTIAKVASAYLEDTMTDDIVKQYIDFISFNNTDLHNFYESIMIDLHKTANEKSLNTSALTETGTKHNVQEDRSKRDILEDITSMYQYNADHETRSSNTQYSLPHEPQYTNNSYQPSSYSSDGNDYTHESSNYSPNSGSYRGTGSYYIPDASDDVETNSTDIPELDTASRQLSRYGVSGGYVYDLARDGYGYGGGGYGGGYGGGHGMTMDPYMIIGSLILGSILGFLLFRALRGTRRGRRDINDGSLSLWNSDVPNTLFWDSSSSSDRMKRDTLKSNSTESKRSGEPNLPGPLRGNTWSTDPFVSEDFQEVFLDESDVANHLNSLWEIYQESNETFCAQSHLCGFMAGSTAERLTSKDSSVTLLMASLNNMIGVTGAGQLVDNVTQSLAMGNAYTCPSVSGCHFRL
ncbi:uncharacterized protein [Palaemon carinicauda]|uniref:uncharacterized protein n=1 Tax=Palaemon carinicauda TaxID=392227 RepID=UPI0035B5CCDF